MFPSFTGSTRPRRQVNLSGRNNNPFAALPCSRTSSSPQTAQNALAQAQQERILRQQERERPPAATQIQKTWRGHKERKEVSSRWREEWDQRENWGVGEQARDLSQNPRIPFSYTSDEDCLSSLRLLVQFASSRNGQDIERLSYFASRYLQSLPLQSSFPVDVWTQALLRLAKLVLSTLSPSHASPLLSETYGILLTLLRNLVPAIRDQLAPYSQEYFRTLTEVAAKHESNDPDTIKMAILGMLQPTTPKIESVYEAYVAEFLTFPDLPAIFGDQEVFARATDYELLAKTLDRCLSQPSGLALLELKSRESLLWLLSYFIYFRRWTYRENRDRERPDAQYVKVVSRLISFLADDIGARIDISYPTSVVNGILQRPIHAVQPLPSFVRSEILTLINQENVSSLLSSIDVIPTSGDRASSSSGEASALASYALTLLRAFPRRGDEIRMWLYRGSTSRQSRAAANNKNLPAIKFFFQAASKTMIFDQISKDPTVTVGMLQPDRSQNLSIRSSSSVESRDQQWRVILLFLELYTFVLKVMDDEEFLSGTLDSDEQWSWTRQSALPLGQVKDLTVFLKNLAFSMYWNATEIAGIEATEAKTSLAEYFGRHPPPQAEKSREEPPAKFAELSVAGVSGMTLAYMKGMVTGVLRMIYERE